MTDAKLDAIGFASAGAGIVINLTAAALVSVQGLVMCGSIVVTGLVMAAIVWFLIRRQRTRGDDTMPVHPERQEFQIAMERFEMARFKARMDELAEK